MFRGEKKIVERERLNLSGVMVQRSHSDVLTRIDEDKNQEIILLGLKPIFKRQKLFKEVGTTNEWQESLIFDARLYPTIGFMIVNEGVNSVDFQLLACIDPKIWKSEYTSSPTPGQVMATIWVASPYPFYKLRVKSTNAGFPSVVSAYISGKR